MDLKLKGFNPNLIIDIGANVGSWTSVTNTTWPRADFLMVEPSHQHIPKLRKIGKPFEIALLGENTTTTSMYVDVRKEMPATENSVFMESAAPEGAFALEPRPMTTLDKILKARNLPSPNMIKNDVQGAELKVLAGAKRALRHIEVVVVEVSLIAWNVGQPLWFEVHARFEELGFQLYDVLEFNRGGSPNRQLLQVDLLFVSKTSILWSLQNTGIRLPTNGWPRVKCQIT